ncbi:MAG: hydroxyacylglutathione hydrolase [Methylotenera sp.]|nr:hydroxyacylglutathione hydrolase [Methylotenera sp.]
MQHNIQIIPIPAFEDNYIWLIHNDQQAIIVDPGDAIPVLEKLQRLNLTLHAVLITHHHQDHIGGVATLQNAYPNAKVYAPKLEQFAFKHLAVSELDEIHLKEFCLTFSVIDLPGHTLGHIAYYCQNVEGNSHLGNILFCGDTLFGAGCGRIFEGTASQMQHSLEKLASLPPATKVYCTHEYTMKNINFALTLEPSNKALIERFIETHKIRDLNLPSLPSTIALELATNPFLRCYSDEIQSAIHLKNASNIEIFSAIRAIRNNY